MAILVIKVADNNVPDGPGKWLQGEIVTATEDSHVFSPTELPSGGGFYHITVTDQTVAQVLTYLKSWGHEPTSVIDSNDGAGGYGVTITSATVSSSGKNAVTRGQMDNFVTKWNGVYASHTNSTYTFDITSFDAATSEGFFGVDASAVTFVDEGFGGGVQQVGITNFGPFTPTQVGNAVTSLGGTIIDSDSFSVPAATLYEGFKDDIESAWSNISFKRRIWNINTAGMNFLAANSGVFSGTAAQVVGYLEDGLTT
jgi:hypothetical protein